MSCGSACPGDRGQALLLSFEPCGEMKCDQVAPFSSFLPPFRKCKLKISNLSCNVF